MTEYGSTFPEDSVSLRFTPAPPIASCVPFGNLYSTGPSPCPCAGVHTPPEMYHRTPQREMIYVCNRIALIIRLFRNHPPVKTPGRIVLTQ